MKYYSVYRPVASGTYPAQGVLSINNFDWRVYCEDIGREAWGWIEYEYPLSEDQVDFYELVPENVRRYWQVITLECKDGRSSCFGSVVDSEVKPKGKRRDCKTWVYITEWYGSSEEARQAVKAVNEKKEGKENDV